MADTKSATKSGEKPARDGDGKFTGKSGGSAAKSTGSGQGRKESDTKGGSKSR